MLIQARLRCYGEFHGLHIGEAGQKGVTMHNELAESVEEVENEVVGGNTASFKPLVINEDEIEDMGGDSSDVEEHGEG